MSSASSDTMQCIDCGAEIEDEAEAVYASGGLDKDGFEKAMEEGEVDARELFGFDDGPYCSIACSIDTEGAE